jgi:carbamoyltransferase
MIAWGINALNHGNSLAVISDNRLQFFKSGTDDSLTSRTINEALSFGAPDRIFWYERPWIKKARQLYAGQYATAFDLSSLPSRHIKEWRLNYAPVTYTPHHASHAAAGYYTSPFDYCAVVVLDAIGEFECATIWEGKDGKLTKRWSRSYPHSLGLFYSAFTKLCGLTPIKDEYLLQKMAAQGDSSRYYQRIRSYFDGTVELNYNFHRGMEHWDDPIEDLQTQCDIAAATQRVFEGQVSAVMLKARQLVDSQNLVYMGGCAMNSQANQYEAKFWNKIWSLPNPGDPSSAIGAVLYHTQQRISWEGDQAKHIAIKL